MFTFWNYFYANIVADVASSFGTSPWYEYFWYTLAKPSFPLGALILLSFLILLIKRPTNLYIWCLVPFLLVHSITPHKEDRFLFPLINFVPVILVLALQEVGKLKLPVRPKPMFRYVAFALLLPLINTLGLAVTATKAVGNGRIGLAHYIHREYNDKPVRLITLPGTSPFNPWPLLKTNFYNEANIGEVRVNSIYDLDASSLSDNQVNLLVISRREVSNPEILKRVYKMGFAELQQSIPVWNEWLHQYHIGIRTRHPLVLYSDEAAKKNTLSRN